MKIIKSLLVVLAAAAVIVGFTKLPRHSAEAQTSFSGVVPQVGLDIGDYGDCSHNYNEGGVPNDGPNGGMPGNNFWTPVGGGDSGYIGVYYHGDGSGYGQGDCVQAGVKTQSSVYNEDFRIGIRATSDGGCNSGWSGWQYSKWASAGGGTSPEASTTSGNGNLACFQLRVQTSTLPAGTTISNLSFTIYGGHPAYGYDLYGASTAGPTSCTLSYTTPTYNYTGSQGVVTPGACPIANVANLGGGSGSAFSYIWASLSDTAIGASETSNNIPAQFSASQTTATGTDGNPIEITMQNSNGGSWYSDKSSVVSQTGSCTTQRDVTAGKDCPAITAAQGTSCTSQVNNTSDQYVLKHISGSFTAGTDPAQYSQITTNACTVGPVGCSNTSAACETSEYACEATDYCSTGGCGANTCSEPQEYGGCGGTWESGCNGTWGPQYSYKVTGSTGVPSGGKGTFLLNSLTAPATPGVYNETWQMQDEGNSFGAPFTIAITVGQSTTTPTVTGTLNVSSTNIVTGGPVVGSWSAIGPTTESSQNTASASYANLPLSGGVANYTTIPDTAQGYALGTVKTQNLAQAKVSGNILAKAFAAIHNAFTSVAFADSELVSAGVCIPSDYSFSTTLNRYTCANGQGWDDSQTLTTALPTAESIIMWYPLATMAASPSSVAVDSGSGQITVQNTGTQGSELDWTASTTDTWFTISSGSGSVVNNASEEGSTGATQNITVTADASKLSSGSYTGTVQVLGTSKYCPIGGCTLLSGKITVTFTGGSCTGSGCIPCSGSSCTPNPVGPTVSISPSSNTITLGQSQKLTIASTDADSCTASGNWSGTESCNGTVTVTPNASGTFNYAIKATNSYGSASDASTIVVQDANGCPGSSCNPPSKPSCTLSASPTSVVVPGLSTLTYSCSNVSSCTISGGGFGTSSIVSMSGTTAKGTTTDAPTTNTFYGINCYGTGPNSTVTATANVQVNVTNPGRSETSTF
jgi:hypothetical protein